jgi:hypothetical protein
MRAIGQKKPPGGMDVADTGAVPVWREKQAMAVVEVVCWLFVRVQIDAIDGNMEEE